MPNLITTLGEVSAEESGMLLPHEHIFVDLGPIEAASYKNSDAAEVVPVMAPYLEEIKPLGVTALVECTPVGVGRRVDIVKAVSEATEFPVLVPTGIYREPWIPQWAHDASMEELRDWMVGELTGQIEETGVQAAWIKLSAGDDGITESESKILQAAAKAGTQTNAIIGSHTIRGSVVLDQLKIIEDAGYDPGRFIWIHTQDEGNFDLHLEVARRGVWLEYDAIGSDWVEESVFLESIQRVLDAGFGHQLMLSHDRGWYDPSQPNGGGQKAFTYLSEVFLPKLRGLGVDEGTINQLTCRNPFRAFAR